MAHMNERDFDEVVRNQVDYTLVTLDAKAKEYSGGGEDRLHNFNQVAKADNCSVERAIWNGFMKHWSSVKDMVDGHTDPTPGMVNEKVGDAINYLFILKAHFVNERKLQCEIQEKAAYE